MLIEMLGITATDDTALFSAEAERRIRESVTNPLMCPGDTVSISIIGKRINCRSLAGSAISKNHTLNTRLIAPSHPLQHLPQPTIRYVVWSYSAIYSACDTDVTPL